MKLNRKGFTLVEVLAVIVILGIIIAIMIPNVNKLINSFKDDNYKNLKRTITVAARSYISDNRYDIEIEGLPCQTNSETKFIIKIDNLKLENKSKIPIETLIDKNYIKEKNGKITNPINNKELNIANSYILVKYSCKTKDYVYTLEDSYLTWN